MDKNPEDSKPRIMRPGGWYWVDKAVVQEFPRRTGFLSLAVYHFLASMADENQVCYPSQKYLADKLGCSRRSVNRAIKRLVEEKLISLWKRAGKRIAYRLLEIDVCNHGTAMRHESPAHVTDGNINNNKEQEKENNIVVRDSQNLKPDGGAYIGTEAEPRHGLLAHDIADALGDHSHYTIYLSYTKQYSESFLRRVLAETRMTPDGKIRKSRAALFNYLVYHYAGKRD